MRSPSLRGLDSGRVAVGVVSTAKYFAPQVLGALCASSSGVEIRLEVGTGPRSSRALEANALDLALTGWPPRKLAVQKAAVR